MARTRKKKTTAEEMAAEADAAERQIRETILFLMQFRRLNQSQLAELTALGRTSLNGKLGPAAKARISHGDAARIAKALNVPRFVLNLDPYDALQWVLDHERPEPGQTVLPLRAGSGASTPTRRRAGGERRRTLPQGEKTRSRLPIDQGSMFRCSTSPLRVVGDLPAAG